MRQSFLSSVKSGKGKWGKGQLLRHACRGVVGSMSPERLEDRRLLTLLIDLKLSEGSGDQVADSALPADPYALYSVNTALPTWVAARAGAPDNFAVALDGVDDSIGGGDISLIVGGTSSVSFWIKTTAAGNNDPLLTPAVLGTGEGAVDNRIFWGFLDATGRIGLNVPGTFPAGGKDTVKSTLPINDDAWHQPEDQYERVSPEYVELAAKLTIAVLDELSRR